MNLDAEAFVKDFVEVAKIAGVNISTDDIDIDPRGVPHTPGTFPSDKMAIYIFIYNDEVLKVGKAGPNSAPRFYSHHYNCSAPSTLAKSLIGDSKSEFFETSCDEIGDLMKKNFYRINYLLDAKYGNSTLSLFEIFLHCRLQPRYEDRC